MTSSINTNVSSINSTISSTSINTMKQRKAARAKAYMASIMFDQDRYVWRKNNKGVWRLDISQFMAEIGKNRGEYVSGLQCGELEFWSAWDMMHPTDSDQIEAHEVMDDLVREEEAKANRLANMREWLEDLHSQVTNIQEEIDELEKLVDLDKKQARRLNKLVWLRDKNLTERIEVMEEDIQDLQTEIQYLSEEDYIEIQDKADLGYDRDAIGIIMHEGEALKRKFGRRLNKRNEEGKLAVDQNALLKLGEWLKKLNVPMETHLDMPHKVKFQKGKKSCLHQQKLEMKEMLQKAWVRALPGNKNALRILEEIQKELGEFVSKKETAKAEKEEKMEEVMLLHMENAEKHFYEVKGMMGKNPSMKEIREYEEAFEAMMAAEEKLNKYFAGELDPRRKEFCFLDTLNGVIDVKYERVIERMDERKDAKRFGSLWRDDDYSDLINRSEEELLAFKEENNL